MKVVLFLAFVTLVAARPNAYEKLESVNSDEIKTNKRLLLSNVHCLIGDGKCTAQATEIKEIVPEAVKTTCAKCNPQQKKIIATIIKAIIEQLPEEWALLYKQYDPEGARKEDLHKFLDENA